MSVEKKRSLLTNPRIGGVAALLGITTAIASVWPEYGPSPEFGISHYQSTTSTGNVISNWRGSGFTDEHWYRETLENFVALHPEFSEGYVASTISKKHEQKKTWDGKPEYRKTVNIKIDYNPRYNTGPLNYTAHIFESWHKKIELAFNSAEARAS